jgi:7-cyano-7-deazaguanine synthase in queuosine biosynthesis
LLHTTKREIRDELGRMFAQTWSCYHPNDGNACGQCGACEARGIL